MRIPIPVAVLVTILTVIGLWWLRTHRMDFMTPKGNVRPLPEFMTGPVDPGAEPEPVVVSPLGGPKPRDPDPQTPSQPEVEYGDLESSPGLAEYSEHSSKGAQYLIRLATELEARGEFQRALLAWERIIDSCTPSDTELQTAQDAVVRIRPTLPRWNIDPEGDVGILLQLGSSRSTTDNLKAAAQEVCDFIRRNSDDCVLITPRITSSSARNRNADLKAPIAVYYSGTGKMESNQSGVLSITPADDLTETYRASMLSACYQLLRRSLSEAGGIQPPRVGDHPESPETDFKRQVTRLHWKIFSQALAHAPDPPSEPETN